MSATRHLLDPRRPPLPQAAAWLVERIRIEPGPWIVAVPPPPAGRRLRERLAAAAGGAPADPPRFAVVAQVLEVLAPPSGARTALEDCRAALAEVLLGLPAAQRRLLSRTLAQDGGVPAAWTLAGRLHDTLRTLWGG